MAIVMCIISLLILIVLPNLAHQRKRAVKTHSKAMVTVVQTQLDLFENDTGKKAANFDQLIRDHYLTSAQVKKAHDERIVISNGRAEQK